MSDRYRMIARLYHATLFALYQTTLALGLCLLPLAVAMKRVGLTLPIRRLLVAAERSYERRSPAE
ncbi:hypothetical protein [Halalkalicoccus subterraneus]|uniref:hypothetical protein n=1 Tax=Halalkalicoccus subterraneus TaxID=2675002 RepID=UPI0013CE4C91|nr:hypothetical protein [Halalkalicoccus subterraneus]